MKLARLLKVKLIIFKNVLQVFSKIKMLEKQTLSNRIFIKISKFLEIIIRGFIGYWLKRENLSLEVLLA